MLDIDQVHRAAEAAAETARAAHQLGHHAGGRSTLGERVPVRAMVAVDGVVGSKLPAHAGGDRLLADAQVHEPVDLVRAGELGDPLLEGADPPHRAEEVEGGAGVDQTPTGAEPTTCCTASTIFASSGRR